MEQRTRRTNVPRTVLAVTVFTRACGAGYRTSYRELSDALDRAEHEAREAPGEDALTGANLERAALVRAVLARNPSVEAAREAWRAALARARHDRALPDPMLEYGFAPL